MDIAVRLERDLVRNTRIDLSAGAGAFDLPPGAAFASRFLGSLQSHHAVDLLRGARGGSTQPIQPGTIPLGALVHLRTSGTTGEPKVRTLRWGALLEMASLVNQAVEYGPDDSWGWCLPCDHIGGVSVLVRALVSGGVADPGSPADLVTRCTHISLVPTQLRDLLDAGVKPSGMLRCALVGGASTPLSWVSEALDMGWPLYATWGATETAAAATIGKRTGNESEGYSGHPLPGVELLFQDQEIVACGPFAPDPVRTGDCGHLAADGSLIVQGRKDQGFTCGGHNVRPSALEASLLELPGVRQAIVLAAEHPRWQHVPIAFLDVVPPPETLDLFASKREPWSVPHAVYQLPLSSDAKMSQAMLRDAARTSAPLWQRDESHR